MKGAYVVTLLPSGKPVMKGEGLKLTVSPMRGGLWFAGKRWEAKGIRVEASEERDVYLNERRYRGRLEVKINSAERLYAINTLELEDYLYGVVQHEVAHWWPMEALEAQAIAARTYAVYQSRVSRTAEYDLKSGTASQVYGGSTLERWRARTAVERTAGKVLVYKGKLFPAYFHSSCGGTTAAASELWKIDLPPVAGGVKCGYCRISPHYFWSADVSLGEIEQILVSNGRRVGQVLKIDAISLTPSGRIGSLRFTGTEGAAVVAAKDFRVWIGGDRMKSTSFAVSVSDDFAKFRGKGWGHGVGLCQWGALGQALIGRKYREILAFYYKESDVTDLSQVREVVR